MPERSTGRQGGELARRASAALVDDSAQVNYGIFHIEDKPWYILDVLDYLNGNPDESLDPDFKPGPWTETLSSAGYGAGTVIIATRRETAGEEANAESTSADPPTAPGPVKGFLATAKPNPSFLYRGARNVELAVQHPIDAAQMTTGDGLAITNAILEIARAAKNQDAPITFLQTPTSSPPGVDRPPARERNARVADETTSLAWQPARVPAIRFAAALSASDGSARIKFFEKVAEFAGLSGARVWIADHRGDRRGGIWLDVLDGSAGDYKLWVKHKLGGADPLIKWVLPVTFVGPARVGSTYEVVNFLAASKVPIVSATIGSLKDLAFIQLGLGSAEQFAWSPEDGMSAAMMLREIAEKLGRTGAGAPDLDRARGYTVCRGVAVPYKPHPPRETAHSMWAAWQVPHRRDALAVVIRTLRTALGAALRSAGIDGNVADQFVADTNIEYAVCRRVETGEVRGRCKLAVPGDVPDKMATPQDRQDRQLTELCRLVEHRWRTALAIELQSSAVEAEFSWRERFLGRWSTLLAGSMS